MVVLQINKFFYEKGGTERYFFSVSDELARRGHEVMHFSMRHPQNEPSKWSDYFVDQVDFDGGEDSVYSLARGRSFIRSREAREKIARLVTVRRPDVAHLHNIYHQLTPSIVAELAHRGIPMVMTLHDHKLICPNYSLFSNGHVCYRCRGGKFYNAVLERCNGGSLRRSALIAVESYAQKWSRAYDAVNRLIAPSLYMQQMFLEAGYDRERVVHLPGFVSPHESSGPMNDVEEDMLEELPERFALYFGRLSAGKGVRVLLDAMARVPQIPLVVCGDGPEKESLQRHADHLRLEHIYFYGHVRRTALRRVLSRASISILPASSPENAPFAVLESAVAAVPTVVSDVGGLPEMALLAGGTVFPSGNAGALAVCLDEIWMNRRSAVDRAQEGRKEILEHYALAHHMQRLEAIYTDAIEARKAAA